MARILKRRGLYEVRGGTREPRPRDPGMTAQQAINTASSALKLGTQVASLIGKIPVKDARAKKLEELEADGAWKEEEGGQGRCNAKNS